LVSAPSRIREPTAQRLRDERSAALRLARAAQPAAVVLTAQAASTRHPTDAQPAAVQWAASARRTAPLVSVPPEERPEPTLVGRELVAAAWRPRERIRSVTPGEPRVAGPPVASAVSAAPGVQGASTPA
jgi:hypothetical protein